MMQGTKGRNGDRTKKKGVSGTRRSRTQAQAGAQQPDLLEIVVKMLLPRLVVGRRGQGRGPLLHRR